ncbi:MAG: hypothetical protein NDF54_03870 [archaeon GB-1867-035]|nr:hypothetical protein [Candidatus Culexmicrobium profundum]
MTVITIRIDEETKRKMKEIKINWSAYIREAIWKKIEEERGKNLAKAVLINEKLKRKSLGEMKAEEIIRKFRDERYAGSSRRRKHNS